MTIKKPTTIRAVYLIEKNGEYSDVYDNPLAAGTRCNEAAGEQVIMGYALFTESGIYRGPKDAETPTWYFSYHDAFEAAQAIRADFMVVMESCTPILSRSNGDVLSFCGQSPAENTRRLLATAEYSLKTAHMEIASLEQELLTVKAFCYDLSHPKKPWVMPIIDELEQMLKQRAGTRGEQQRKEYAAAEWFVANGYELATKAQVPFLVFHELCWSNYVPTVCSMCDRLDIRRICLNKVGAEQFSLLESFQKHGWSIEQVIQAPVRQAPDGAWQTEPGLLLERRWQS